MTDNNIIMNNQNIKNIVMQNTDLTFLLSDYLDDTSSKSLFKSQRLYRNMITNNPDRYKVKRSASLMKIFEELYLRQAEIKFISDEQINIEFYAGEYEYWDPDNDYIYYPQYDILKFTLNDNGLHLEFLSNCSNKVYEEFSWFKELILLIKDYILSYGITWDMNMEEEDF